jgi:fimbrial chaperone protein
MIRATRFATAFLLALPTVSAARAASLQVAPVSLEIAAPGATGVITLHNASDRPLAAQARVFRWRQIDGRDELEETEAVVASPPFIELESNQSYSIRIVRTDPSPVSEPENYRLLVDELPNSATQRSGRVNLVLRYSLPVFFTQENGGDPKLSWSVRKQNGRLLVTLRNDGDRHVRVSALRLKDRSGATVSFGSGLVGYALGRSTVQWTSPPAKAAGSSFAEISAQSDLGEIHASASPQ